MENLFLTIQKTRFSEKQQQMIADLVDNAFFYEESDSAVSSDSYVH